MTPNHPTPVILSDEQVTEAEQRLSRCVELDSLADVRALCATVQALRAEHDDLLNRSHQTVIFECGCVFKQDGLDAEPQLTEHCTLWAEAERNAMIDTIAELEKELADLRQQLTEAQDRLQLAAYAAEEYKRQAIAAISEVEQERDDLCRQLAETQRRLAEYERLEKAVNMISERVLIPEVLAAMERLREQP